MENLFFLEARCVNCGRTFYPRYDLAADNVWVLTYGVVELPQGQTAVGTEGPGINIDNRRCGPQFRCPWCGNDSFVKCGKCGHLTCYDVNSGVFNCAYCGNKGRVSGSLSNKELKGIVRTSGSGQR